MTLKHFIFISLAIHVVAFLAIALLTRQERRAAPVAYFVKVVEEPSAAPHELPQAKPRPAEKPKAEQRVGRAPDIVRGQERAPQPPAATTEKPEGPGPPDATAGKPAPEPPEFPTPEEGVGRFLDRDVIQEFARKETDEKKESKGITFDTEEFRYRSYMERLREKIEGIWVYPVWAAERGIYGDLVIRFVIRKDGSLGSVELLRTSGHTVLDEAALTALREGQPFWPLPEGWNQSSLTITGHFIYTLYGVRIR